MNSNIYRGCSTLVMALALAAAASAQERPHTNGWSHATTLNVFAGVASEPAGGSGMVGGSIGWQLTRTMAIEGSGSWINGGEDADWFAGALKLQTTVGRVSGAVPFVEAGIGLYRASFDANRTDMPEFYGRRMGSALRDGMMMRTFTDPSVVFGGGISMDATRHIAIRPAVELTTVLRDNHTFVTVGAMVRMTYRFEDRPVTRARNAW
jgi:hypothetical protein